LLIIICLFVYLFGLFARNTTQITKQTNKTNK